MKTINSQLSGLLLIDKSANLTSTAVVRKIKKTLNISRVGHLGTLDPFATGLLPIMIGSATRLSTELMDFDKEYLFTIQLGIETDTLDPTGQIIKRQDAPTLCSEQILDILKNFIGSIQQIPPIYSAIKMNGRPLYEYMRTCGKIPFDIETKARMIHIKSCLLETFDACKNTITIRVSCSKGTYVRSLARDIAYALNTVGMCSDLRRTKIGEWDTSLALNVDDKNNENIFDYLIKNIIPPEQLLSTIPKILLPEKFFRFLNTGNIFQIKQSENLELFDSLKLLLNSQDKFFIGIQDQNEILFLSHCILMNDDTILCKPQKKII